MFLKTQITTAANRRISITRDGSRRSVAGYRTIEEKYEDRQEQRRTSCREDDEDERDEEEDGYEE